MKFYNAWNFIMMKFYNYNIDEEIAKALMTVSKTLDQVKLTSAWFCIPPQLAHAALLRHVDHSPAPRWRWCKAARLLLEGPALPAPLDYVGYHFLINAIQHHIGNFFPFNHWKNRM